MQTKNIIRIAFVVGLISLIPFVVMQFAEEVVHEVTNSHN